MIKSVANEENSNGKLDHDNEVRRGGRTIKFTRRVGDGEEE